MELPPANLILFFLSAFTGLWGVSVLVRAARGRRVPGSRACPECRTEMLGVAGRRCPACQFEARCEAELERRERDARACAVGIIAAAAGAALVPVAVWVRRWEGTGYGDGLGMHPVGAMFWGVAVFGLVLAAWGGRGDRSRGRRRCPRCWYDMSGTPRGDAPERSLALRCPECGHDAGGERGLYRARRLWRLVWIGGALALLGMYGQVMPRAIRVGPLGMAPTSLLITGIGWLPDSWYVGSKQNSGATLLERFDRGELWAWQVHWLRARIRSSVESRILAVPPSLAGGVMDDSDDADRCSVVVGLARLLGDAGRRISTTEADEFSRSYLGFFPWWSELGPATAQLRAEEAASAASSVLLQRAASKNASEAELALGLLACQRTLPDGQAEILAERILPGRTPQRAFFGAFLGKYWFQSTEARGMLRAMLAAETLAEREAALYGISDALNRSSDDELLGMLADTVRSCDDPRIVSRAATILAESGSESAAFRELISESDLPLSARAGVARAWEYVDRIPLTELVGVALPALASDDTRDLHSVLGFLLHRVQEPNLPAKPVVAPVSALIAHADMSVRDSAVLLLRELRVYHPEVEAQVDAVLGANGIDPGLPDE